MINKLSLANQSKVNQNNVSFKAGVNFIVRNEENIQKGAKYISEYIRTNNGQQYTHIKEFVDFVNKIKPKRVLNQIKHSDGNEDINFILDSTKKQIIIESQYGDFFGPSGKKFEIGLNDSLGVASDLYRATERETSKCTVFGFLFDKLGFNKKPNYWKYGSGLRFDVPSGNSNEALNQLTSDIAIIKKALKQAK